MQQVVDRAQNCVSHHWWTAVSMAFHAAMRWAIDEVLTGLPELDEVRQLHCVEADFIREVLTQIPKWRNV